MSNASSFTVKVHTILDLQLSHPNRRQDIVLPGLLRFLEVAHSIAGRSLLVTHTTGTDVAVTQDTLDVSKLNGALRKFESLLDVRIPP